MESERDPRPRITDIIKASGAFEIEEGDSGAAGQVAALGALITGQSAGVVAASQALGDVLGTKFNLRSEGAVERTFPASYETTGRALVLALEATKYKLVAAIDTKSGARIEAESPMRWTAGATTLSLTISDPQPAATHVAGVSRMNGTIVDFGRNAKFVETLFAKTEEYLRLFES